MTFVEFLGCALIAFGPSLSLFCLVIAKNPIQIIILITASFFWLLSLLSSSILWTIVVPLRDQLIFAITFSIFFQEGFRWLFYKFLRSAENGLQKVSEVGEKSTSCRTNSRMQLSLVSGLGFGLISGAFSIVNILADSAGPGTVGINGDSHYFFLCSALTTLAFTILHICWSMILFHALDTRNIIMMVYVVVSHLASSYITLLNSLQLYYISIPIEYFILLISAGISLKICGFNFARLGSICKGSASST